MKYILFLLSLFLTIISFGQQIPRYLPNPTPTIFDDIKVKKGFVLVTDSTKNKDTNAVVIINGNFWLNFPPYRQITTSGGATGADSVYKRNDSLFYKLNNAEHWAGVVFIDIQFAADVAPGDPFVVGSDNKSATTQHPSPTACNNSGNIMLAHGTGTTVYYSSGFYSINCTQYTISTSGSLNVPDFAGSPGEFRRDAIVGTTAKTITYVEGDYSTDQIGVDPSIDVSTQVLIGYVTLNSDNAFVGTDLSENVYINKAASGEWQTRGTIGTITAAFNYITNPHSADSSIRVSAANNNGGFYIQDAVKHSKSGFTNLVIWMRNNAIYSANRNWQVRLYNGTTQVGLSINPINFGYSRTLLNTWMPVSIPISAFQGADSINRVEIRNTGTGGTVNVQFDDIVFQAGITTVGSGDPNAYISGRIANNNLYMTHESGVEDLIGSVGDNVCLTNLTFASPISWTDPCRQAYVKLIGNGTLSVPAPVEGGFYTITIAQDGTGGRTITVPGGSTPTIRANANDTTTIFGYFRKGGWEWKSPLDHALQNGLTNNGGTGELGGPLIRNTQINISGYQMNLDSGRVNISSRVGDLNDTLFTIKVGPSVYAWVGRDGISRLSLLEVTSGHYRFTGGSFSTDLPIALYGTQGEIWGYQKPINLLKSYPLFGDSSFVHISNLDTTNMNQADTAYIMLLRASFKSYVDGVDRDKFRWYADGSFWMAKPKYQGALPDTLFGYHSGYLVAFPSSAISGGGGGGAAAFTDLTDAPASYSGAALKGVRVNSGATGLEFYTISSGFANPMTTTGDIIYSSDNSGTADRLPAGTAGYVLKSNGPGVAPSYQQQVDESKHIVMNDMLVPTPVNSIVNATAIGTVRGTGSFIDLPTNSYKGFSWLTLSTGSSTTQLSSWDTGNANITVGSSTAPKVDLYFTNAFNASAVSDGTDTYRLIAGLTEIQVSNVYPDNGAYFTYTHSDSSGKIVCVLGNGTKNNKASSVTFAANTNYQLRITIDNGTAYYYINGNLEATLTSNYPGNTTNLMVQTAIKKSAGTTNRKLYTDNVKIVLDYP